MRCVVYTGDTDATGEEILQRAQERFNMTLPGKIDFIFLNRRKWVEAKPYPYFTLLGQSLGSVLLGWEALMKCVPDIYIDTMGYAFTIPLFRSLAGCHVGCYVHYPTISTDMLDRVSNRSALYNNSAFIARSVVFSRIKLIYYQIFAWLYGAAGRRSDFVMVNSTWTRGHIVSLWKQPSMTHTVYPPCDTDEFLRLPLQDDTNNEQHTIVSVAQFRPEKDHPLQLRAFKEFLDRLPQDTRSGYKLVLVGSCRDEEDTKRVSTLKLLAEGLQIIDSVEFRLNVSFSDLKQSLSEATVGLHTMMDEHFGIGQYLLNVLFDIREYSLIMS